MSDRISNLLLAGRPLRCRREAAQCRRNAEIADVPDVWLELASQWESLAEKLDALGAPDRRSGGAHWPETCVRIAPERRRRGAARLLRRHAALI
jgi:hypothetical protein